MKKIQVTLKNGHTHLVSKIEIEELGINSLNQETIKDIKLLDESEKECEYGNDKYCDNPCCMGCALARKKCKARAKQKIEKLVIMNDDNWSIMSSDGHLFGDCDKTRDQVLLIKLNEIIDLLNSKE